MKGLKGLRRVVYFILGIYLAVVLPICYIVSINQDAIQNLRNADSPQTDQEKAIKIEDRGDKIKVSLFNLTGINLVGPYSQGSFIRCLYSKGVVSQEEEIRAKRVLIKFHLYPAQRKYLAALYQLKLDQLVPLEYEKNTVARVSCAGNEGKAIVDISGRNYQRDQVMLVGDLARCFFKSLRALEKDNRLDCLSSKPYYVEIVYQKTKKKYIKEG